MFVELLGRSAGTSIQSSRLRDLDQKHHNIVMTHHRNTPSYRSHCRWSTTPPDTASPHSPLGSRPSDTSLRDLRVTVRRLLHRRPRQATCPRRHLGSDEIVDNPFDQRAPIVRRTRLCILSRVERPRLYADKSRATDD